MATAAAPVGPDSVITVKVQFGQENRRFKLPLKELTPAILPAKLRMLLAVPEDKAIILQRYSDSSAAYVTLNEKNSSVYKQLYRAAKAKLKLRIKVDIADAAAAAAAAAEDEAKTIVAEAASEPDKQDFLPRPQFSYPPVPMRLTDLLSDSPPSAIPPADQPASPQPGLPLPVETKEKMRDMLRFIERQQQLQHNQMQALAQRNAALARGTLGIVGEQRSPTQLNTPPQPCQPPKLEGAPAAGRPFCLPMRTESPTTKVQSLPKPNQVTWQHTEWLRGPKDQFDVPTAIAPATASAHAPASKAAPVPEVDAKGCLDAYDFAHFAVCCNNCNSDIPGAHWHCSICQEGDYDLCQVCVESGTHCQVDSHFLIKRLIENGRVINSTVLTLPKRGKSQEQAEKQVLETATEESQKSKDAAPAAIPGAFAETKEESGLEPDASRTCNSCVNVFHESRFVTCLDCDDYDLCFDCHKGVKHGHHPAHTFKAVSESALLDPVAVALCAPGRKVRHFALCDGCDKDISGVRHKCLNCPDWDYCNTCIKSAAQNHPGHRFAPIYESIPLPSTRGSIHHNVRCDGPLCKSKPRGTVIIGDRYKCSICYDTDFCASCEALPTNTHNRTHPLIKLRTPIRSVDVTTFHDVGDDQSVNWQARTKGKLSKPTESKSTETTPTAPLANAATQVQTVAEAKPIEAVKEAAKIESARSSPAPKLDAHFVCDLIHDGTRFEASSLFEQVWTLRNPGPVAWPAGCSLRFVGGDRMLNIDDKEPGSVSDLDKAAGSNCTSAPVQVGENVRFTVLLKAPRRSGKAISYWRVKTADGVPFGHKLWCEIDVVKMERTPATKPESALAIEITPSLDVYVREKLEGLKKRLEEVKPQIMSVTQQGKEQGEPSQKIDGGFMMGMDVGERANVAAAKAEPADIVKKDEESLHPSQMIFPKLEKESAESSMHEAAAGAADTVNTTATDAPPAAASPCQAAEPADADYGLVEEVESVGLEDEVEDDSTDAGFLTDEEYEILDHESGPLV